MIANVLTIAGSDSGGGAGIQADLKTFSALRCYGLSVVTAITAQNTREVSAIHALPAAFVAAQLEAVFSDIEIDAVKIGMLGAAPVIEAVAAALERWRPPFVVLDPVMVAKSGAALLPPDSVDALRSRLLPLATLVTPNLPEAGVLLDGPAPTDEDGMIDAAGRLRALGARAVLVKGGHGAGDSVLDLLEDGQGILPLEAPRIATTSTHGTGCTLASAIAAELAKGRELRDAVRLARDYLQGAIRAAGRLRVGSGHGPVHHFHALWQGEDG